MFEVLVYVYENYWQGDACPETDRLGRKLTAAGFEAEEIREALVWLDGLNLAAQSTQIAIGGAGAMPARSVALFPLMNRNATDSTLAPQSDQSLRAYSVSEQAHLGAQCLGFICFLESSGVLPPHMREIVIDRAMAAPGNPFTLDDLKIIVLMVYWSFGQEPEALVLDELCDDAEFRIAH
jgi:Smg protein